MYTNIVVTYICTANNKPLLYPINKLAKYARNTCLSQLHVTVLIIKTNQLYIESVDNNTIAVL